MTTSVQPDSLFQICITNYPSAFGIEDIEALKIQKRSIVPESVYIDAVITFDVDFDFTKLTDRIFPFLGKENVVEYKGKRDDLTVKKFCQYSMTELGLVTCDFLSKKGEEGTEPPSLSQKVATTQWQHLNAQGAKHSCTTVIVSTADPKGLRRNFGFEPVDTYDHLSGCLYRLVIFNNKLVGNIAVYIVVINDLPVHPKNAPLLLLSTGSKLEEFLVWLLETHDELTLQQKKSYLSHLMKYNSVENREVVEKVLKNVNPIQDYTEFAIEILIEKLTEEGRLKTAQMALQADSPEEVAQKALQDKSPQEAALNFIHSEEEIHQLLELFRQRNAEQSQA